MMIGMIQAHMHRQSDVKKLNALPSYTVRSYAASLLLLYSLLLLLSSVVAGAQDAVHHVDSISLPYLWS